jgi:protein O-mannosyl-transferase
MAKQWLAVPACAVMLALTLVSHRQLGYWHDSETLWRYALSVTDGNFIAHSNLARVMAADNRSDEAIAEFIQAENLHNYALPDVLHFGDYEILHGHFADAASTFHKILRSTQDAQLRKAAYTDLGVANVKTGKFAAARENFESALQIAPRDPYALIGLGLIAHRNGDFTTAADYFSQSVHSKPTDLGYLLLATALQNAGRLPEANAAYTAAQQMSPDLTKTRQMADQYLY